MKKRQFLLSQFLIFLLFITSLSKAQTFPIQINDYGFIFVDITLNDSVKGKFIFDTGGGVMLVSNKIYKQVESSLKRGEYFTGFRHDGDRLDGELKIFPSVALGNYKLTNVYGGVYPQFDEYGLDGLVSLKQFENQPVTIDFKDKTLTLETKESLDKIEKSAEIMPIALNTYIDYGLDIFVTLCLNDSVKIKAEFDTGSGFNLFLVNPYFIQRTIQDTSALKPQDYTAPVSGKKSIDKLGKINSVSYCGTSVSGNDIGVIFREGLIYEGLIGSGMFKDKILTIDIPNKRMLVRK